MDERGPSSCPPMSRKGWGVGRADKLQNSLELRETSPSRGVGASPVCSAWVLRWGPGG